MKNVTKKTTTQKTVVKESVGRDLVGASGFANRSTVIDLIMKKYPTPQALSVALKKLAANNENEKVQKKILEIAAKAETLDVASYPAFVKKIAGFNKLWGIAGKTVGAAAVMAGVAWVASAFYKAGMEQVQQAQADQAQYDANVAAAKEYQKQGVQVALKPEEIAKPATNAQRVKAAANAGVESLKKDVDTAATKGKQVADAAVAKGKEAVATAKAGAAEAKKVATEKGKEAAAAIAKKAEAGVAKAKEAAAQAKQALGGAKQNVSAGYNKSVEAAKEFLKKHGVNVG